MDFSGHEREPGKKLWGFAFVILVHVLIVYALLTGLARKVVEVVRQPVEAKIIEEPKPPVMKDLPPPPPQPKLAAPPPPPFIPPPEVRVQTPPPPNAITPMNNTKPDTPVMPAPQPAAPAPQPQTAAAAPVRTPAVVDAGNCQKPEYPRKSLRMEEQGTVVLRFLIGVDGRVVESQVERSSGHRDLDNAARNALSLCRFKPGTVDGKPEQSWTKMEYVWKIE
jgi:protein TonB